MRPPSGGREGSPARSDSGPIGRQKLRGAAATWMSKGSHVLLKVFSVTLDKCKRREQVAQERLFLLSGRPLLRYCPMSLVRTAAIQSAARAPPHRKFPPPFTARDVPSCGGAAGCTLHKEEPVRPQTKINVRYYKIRKYVGEL